MDHGHLMFHIVLQTAPFQLRLTGVNNCGLWNVSMNVEVSAFACHAYTCTTVHPYNIIRLVIYFDLKFQVNVNQGEKHVQTSLFMRYLLMCCHPT